MRAGGIAKTAAVNVSAFMTDFEKLLLKGKNILYLGFSSTFSATYQSAVIAAQQLRKRHPQRKMLTVDTLCACAGQALLGYLTLEKKQSGATSEEAAAFAEKQKPHMVVKNQFKAGKNDRNRWRNPSECYQSDLSDRQRGGTGRWFHRCPCPQAVQRKS